MYYVAAFMIAIFITHNAAAEGVAPGSPALSQSAGVSDESAIAPTLGVAAKNPTEASLDALYPKLPVASGYEAEMSEPTAGTASNRISGYILNRQLVEQTARAYPTSGVELAQGWNSFLNRASANICVEGTVEKLSGTNLSASITSVEDRSSYFDSISGSVGGAYGAFSGSGSYLKERQFSNYDANVVLNAVVDTGGRFIRPSKGGGIRLTDDALRLLKMKDGVSRFLQACGDSVVTAIREGGRLSAILSVSKINQSSKEIIQAQASGGFGALSANGNFRKTVDSASQGDKLRLSYEQVGGVFGGVPVNIDELLAKFTQYNVDNIFGPRPYVFFTQNYRSLPNWPDGLENRVSPVDQEFFVLSYYNFTDLGSDYAKAIKDPGSFRNFLSGGPDEVVENRDIALNYARNLDLAIWNCVNDFDCSLDNLERIDRRLQGSLNEVQRSSASDGSEQSETEYAQGAFSDFYVVATKSVVGTSDAKSETTEVGVMLPKMTVGYYRLLAALPIYSDGKETGFSVPLTDGAPPPDDEILRGFRNWLIASRLRPVAEGYCRRSASHPLCLSGRELRYIVNLLKIAVDPLRPEPQPMPETELPPDPPTAVQPAPKLDQCERLPLLCRQRY